MCFPPDTYLRMYVFDFSILFLFCLITAYVTSIFKKLKPKLERATESRLQRITELVGGIQVLKMLVLDDEFKISIANTRK